MPYSIQSLLLIGEELKPIAELEPADLDPDDLQGAIEWRIYDEEMNAEILSVEHCDLIDQLWAQIIHGALVVFDGQPYDGVFAEQRLHLVFEVAPLGLIRITIGKSVHLATREDFFESVVAGGREFFQSLPPLVPTTQSFCAERIAEIDELEKKRCRDWLPLVEHPVEDAFSTWIWIELASGLMLVPAAVCYFLTAKRIALILFLPAMGLMMVGQAHRRYLLIPSAQWSAWCYLFLAWLGFACLFSLMLIVDWLFNLGWMNL